MINIVAAVGKNLELGKDGGLIFDIPNDLKYFKKLTLGHTVVMGRRTYESIGKALSDRRNVVITSSNIEDRNIIVMHNYEEVFELTGEIFIIGGESIYRLFLPYADNLYLTEVDASYDKADTFFPFFDKELYDKEIIGIEEENNLKYSYVRYRKK